MKKNFEKKSLIVNELGLILKSSNIISLISYVGIKSFDIKILRQNFYKNNIGVKAVKNSLAKKIFINIKYDSLINYLDGQVLLVFSENVFSTIAFLNGLKNINSKFFVKKTAINNFLISRDSVDYLLKFNNNSDMICKLVYTLKVPFFKLLNSLEYPGSCFLNLVKSIKMKGENNVN